jgi:hypothetical protein
VQEPMSALGQKQTHAVQNGIFASCPAFFAQANCVSARMLIWGTEE